MKIRLVNETDSAALLEIYSPYVENTVITFEYTVPSLEEFTARIREISSKYPYLVAEEDGVPIGYAYASPFKTRAAYNWSVETSIYTRMGAPRKGIGTALYLALEEYLAKQNIYNLCACITFPNPESVSFHEKFGYKTVAHFHKAGYKNGNWHDIIWMEKVLSPHPSVPLPFLPVSVLR